DKLAGLLQENPTIKIEIGGHTDNVGKAVDNLTLSDQRAKAVVDYLLAKKIDPARLSAKGYGITQPVADNNTPEGRALNRRTEMKITGL
ncbi:MAG: OmpA family protein, partial [Chitinophagia bacterium]|nr:OmpA family protein [Chitinophagia bacterium]